METQIPTRKIRLVARVCLGLIWVYQGFVPKFLVFVPLEHAIVKRTSLYAVSPSATIKVIGIFEIAAGLWLLSGYFEKLAVLLTSGFLLVLTTLVVIEAPFLLAGPFGGIIKNISLFVLAWIVWRTADAESSPSV